MENGGVLRTVSNPIRGGVTTIGALELRAITTIKRFSVSWTMALSGVQQNSGKRSHFKHS
jgi:hypothetical protein